MHRFRLAGLLALAALALRTSGQTPEPDAAARNGILARMKNAAANYTGRFQDFLCVELIKRSKEDSGLLRHWQALDTQEREVSYVAHQEHFRTLKVNGKAPRNHEDQAGLRGSRATNSGRR
jgi:hypothetical protein